MLVYLLVSVYEKKDSISRVLWNALHDEANGIPFSVYYADIGKATALFQVARVPMPKMPVTNNGGFLHSVTEPGSPVKRQLNSMTETQQFKRWFRDSKVINGDGTPKRD